MNRIKSLPVFSALFVAAMISACQPDAPAQASAPVGNPELGPVPDARPNPASPQVAAASGHTAGTPTEAAIPATADAIWLVIDQKRAALRAAIEANQLDQVHHLAFAIRDHIAALPARTSKQSDEDKAKLDGEIGFVATLADRLDQAGDSGDQASARENFDKLDQVLERVTRYK